MPEPNEAKRKWTILAQYSGSEGILAVLLRNRGILTEKEKAAFLNPPPLSGLIKNLNPTLLKSFAKARDFIVEAMSSGSPIVVFGDYDADGVCATAILCNTLKKELHYEKCTAFIPNRFSHSYGLSPGALEDAMNLVTFSGTADKRPLLITVDTGITELKNVEYAKRLGFDVIITDHHQKPKQLPKANHVVWTDEIVGSGISYILGKGLGSKSSDNLALAAIATVADLQPLLGFNRSVVKEGLEIINTRPPNGIKKLLEVAGKRNEVTAFDLGWVVGPRLNASGRLIDAADSLSLLTENNLSKVEELAAKLNLINVQRQDKTLEMYELANISSDRLPRVIISHNKDYHEGIIGLVAGKLVQTYWRPSIVISLSKELGKGSVRSIPGVDIIAFLRNFENLFISLGGHPMAAGFTILKKNIAVLEERITKLAQKVIGDDLLIPSIDVDMNIPIELVDLAFANELYRLKPFGIGNREPVFLSEGLGVSSLDVVGRDGKHLSMRLFADGKVYKAVYFNKADLGKELAVGDKIDLVFSVKKNEYKDKEYVDLVVRDIRVRPSEGQTRARSSYDSIRGDYGTIIKDIK